MIILFYFCFHTSFFIFQIPLRSSCHYGKHPHKISSNKEFNLFIKGVDYSKIKDNTLCGGNLPASDWRILFTTNLVVFVFHRYQRVLAGPGARKSPRGKKATPRPHIFGEGGRGHVFIDDEAQVCYILFFIRFLTRYPIFQILTLKRLFIIHDVNMMSF